MTCPVMCLIAYSSFLSHPGNYLLDYIAIKVIVWSQYVIDKDDGNDEMWLLV